ncbi:hypothetical protein [Sorangium sp. So ce381]|uniref:hypothetical protein n=1 Tax=Sorangium sp. So ce381 TaxID=3133307 RepID=UPI003F5C45B5
MNTTVRTLLRGAVAASMALGAMLSASPARAALSCFVGFDDFDALNGMWADARATFTYETGYADGYLVPCEEAEGSCWTYRQYCEGMQRGTNYINVEDGSGYGHYHLSFTNPGFTGCGFVDPGDGQGPGTAKLIGGACGIPNWPAEPRKLQSHVADQWIKVWNGTNERFPQPFRMSTITVGDMPIQLWYRRISDGQWFVYESLAANTIHTLFMDYSSHVFFKAASEDAVGPYTIWNFEVNAPS